MNPRIVAPLSAVALLALPAVSPAAAASEPPRTGPPVAAAEEAPPAAPARAMDAGPAPVIELEAWTLPPDPRAHRGGVWTGSPEPLPAATAGELHKLALARAAVDAARAAGTLRRGIDEELGRLSPAERDALKRQRGADLPPAELIPDPAAGVGEVGPLREPGPPGLTADERDRRDRWTPADALPGQTEEVPE